ncbi:MAG TPA: methyltransferase domain-containing protein [Gemmatimonadaceae bacterium]|nr:methyltransferase domain-containing protein [Gemmatimonadaceae bacterium]
MAVVSWQDAYLAKYYPPSSGWIDGETEFRRLCAASIRPGSEILEIGSGPPNSTSRFLSSLGRVTGVDVDPDVRTNDALVAAHVLSDETYPLPDCGFDACVSDYVIEHIADPESHLREVARVLKPGGVYVFRTPNRFHYVTLAARLTPHWFHVLVANRLRNLPADSHQPYRTSYRMNSTASIRAAAAAARLEVEELRLLEKDPWYGRSSRALFLLFMLYERLVNSHEVFAGLRANFLATLRKPQNHAGTSA